MSIRVIPATEVAKLVRNELRFAFPNTRFSVRTKWYGLDQVIVIRWKGRTPRRIDVSSTVDHLRGYELNELDGWDARPIKLPSGEIVQLGNTSIMYENDER